MFRRVLAHAREEGDRVSIQRFLQDWRYGFSRREEGRLTIVGRDKDVVISGGLNIYPAEIESAIDEYDGIVETAVVGAPHPDFGEGLIAVVVTTRPVALVDLREFLSDRLASFKHPKALMQIEELPRNAMGKIQKNSLREQFADTFQLMDRRKFGQLGSSVSTQR